MSPGGVVPGRFYDLEYTIAAPLVLLPDYTTALLIVDMQYHDASPACGFNLAIERTRPGSLDYYNERVESMVVPTIAELLTYFRKRKMSVIYLTLGSDDPQYRDMPARSRALVLDLEARSGVSGILWSGNPEFRIRDELAPVADEPVVRKTTAGAFSSSDLDEVLRRRGIENLVVTGVTTSCCVESTAREASDHGYGCVLVDHAMAEYDAEAHDATLRTFHTNFGRVLTTAHDVISALRERTEL